MTLSRGPFWVSCFLLAAVIFARDSFAAPFVQIGQNFTGSVAGIDSISRPPDADGAVGLAHFVEFINGRYSVYSKRDGQRVQTMTDLQFWDNAGLPIASNLGVTDPRLTFDNYSQRWFASMVDFNLASPRQTRNRFLLAISEGSDPTGTWHAYAFTADPVNGDFADFPTLGVDRTSIFLSAGLFTPRTGLNLGSVLVAVPKDGLLATPPSISGLVSFGTLAFNTHGQVLQPAITSGEASSGGTVLAVGNLGLDPRAHTTLLLTAIPNLTTTTTISSGIPLTVPDFSAPPRAIQPDGSNNLDAGDARFSASIRQVRDILYAVQSTVSNSRAAVRWYRIDALNATLLETGLVVDPNLDLIYPSIAANDSGTVVIACNGSSSDKFVSCYAAIGEPVNGALTFGDLITLKAGEASYQTPDSTGISRWGDYSATSVDPTDSSRFWTIQTYAAGRTVWATQITELITNLRLSATLSATGLTLSWPASSANLQLQSTPSLPASGTWAPVAQTLHIVNGEASVTLPTDASHGFFRLAR